MFYYFKINLFWKRGKIEKTETSLFQTATPIFLHYIKCNALSLLYFMDREVFQYFRINPNTNQQFVSLVEFFCCKVEMLNPLSIQ